MMASFDMKIANAKVHELIDYLMSHNITALEYVTDDDWLVKLEKQKRQAKGGIKQ